MQPEMDAVAGRAPEGASAPSAPWNGVDSGPATAATDRSISRHAPMIVATNGWPLLADQACADHRCCDERLAIAGRAPGEHPLRRRREMELIEGRPRLRGSPIRPAPMIVATNGWPLLADQACPDHRRLPPGTVSLPAVPPLVLSCVYVPSSMRQKCKARIAGTSVCPSSPSRRRQG